MKRVDYITRGLQVLTGLTVTALAGVAGAISFSHMSTLATQHGQTRWQAGAFPISVDGLELVASLYLVVQHRAGRQLGLLPWAALIVGTVASLAANVAVGGHDLIGRAIAGWPAISLLVSVKLLFSMIDHVRSDGLAVRDDQAAAPADAVVSGTAAGTVPADPNPSRSDRGPGTNGTASDADDRGRELATQQTRRDRATLDSRDVAHLIPAARSARTTLATTGRRLSRDALADQMRHDGHGVSSARATLLLKILKAEETATPMDPPTAPPDRVRLHEHTDNVA